jgi:hypothetical protein
VGGMLDDILKDIDATATAALPPGTPREALDPVAESPPGRR